MVASNKLLAARKPTIGYVRVSTIEQAQEGHSLEAQEGKIRAYCALQEMPLDRVIPDDGYSAKTLDRPGMSELLAMVERGRVGRIVISKLDRITRSLRDLLDLVERFNQHKVEFVSVGDSIDTSNASGRLILNLLGSIIQWQRENTAETTAETMTSMMKQGKRVSRNPHFGYRLGATRIVQLACGKNKVITDLVGEPREQEAIAQMLRLRSEGVGLHTMAKELERQGFTGRNGQRLAVSTIHAIIRRESR
jgi:DNA invertase Pin-like site-specific DNA recombinase